jgi:hypothetical protein
LEDDFNTIKNDTEALIDAGKEAGLEEETEKCKSILMYRHNNERQNIKVANRTFETVAKFRYL